MNTVNNKRRRESQERIERCLIELLQTKEVKDISVSDICKRTKLNRSTFYANYIDIYDLVDKLKIRMMDEFFSIYKEECETKMHSYNFLKLFEDIKENQLFYKTYFKLDFDLTSNFLVDSLKDDALKHFGTTKTTEYHIEFFKAGISAVIKKWLANDCKESPLEIEEIIKSEYSVRIV